VTGNLIGRPASLADAGSSDTSSWS